MNLTTVKNTALQTVATLFLGGAVVLYNGGSFVEAAVIALVGIIAYVAYELVP